MPQPHLLTALLESSRPADRARVVREVRAALVAAEGVLPAAAAALGIADRRGLQRLLVRIREREGVDLTARAGALRAHAGRTGRFVRSAVTALSHPDKSAESQAK